MATTPFDPAPQSADRPRASPSCHARALEWQITVNPGHDLVTVTTAGFADRDGSLAMAQALMATMRQHGLSRALIDHRNIVGAAGEVIDIYDRPKHLRALGAVVGIRIAEVIRPEHRAHFEFLETVCVNRGFLFAVFHDPERALQWLQQQ